MKIFLLIGIIVICSGQTDSLIQLGNGATLKNLSELTNLSADDLNCQTNFVQLNHQFKMWAELYQDEKILHHEIKILSNAHRVLAQQTFNRHRISNTLTRAKKVLASFRHNTHKKQHTLYQQWRQNELSNLKGEINFLQTSLNEVDSTQCCDRIEKLINKFLDERKHIVKQCKDPKITINIINDKENRVQIINQTCKNNDNTVQVKRVDPANVIVGQSQEQKKEEAVVVTHQDEAHDFDGTVHSNEHEGHENSEVVEQTHEHEIQDGTVHGEGIHGEWETKEVSEPEVEDDFDGNVDGDAQFDSEEFETQETVVEEGEYMSGEIGGSQIEPSEEDEEVVTQTTTTKTTTTKTVFQPLDDDDEEVEGEIVQTQGVGASGEGGRV